MGRQPRQENSNKHKLNTMKKYRVTLIHDNGKAIVYATGKDEEAAIKQVMGFEGCPRSAIIKLQLMPYWVTMTDKFMSGWGKAEGKVNKFIVVCESYEDAWIVKQNAEKRSEMKHINITATKPRYGRNAIESWRHFDELGEIWKK